MIISPQHAWQSSTELACFSKELSLKIQSNLQGHMITHTVFSVIVDASSFPVSND